MSEIPLNRWFVVQVRPMAEKMVALLLRHKGYEDFLPLYTPSQPGAPAFNSRRELPLFPGYVFCKSTQAAGSLIVTTPGVVRILGIGGKPQPIDDVEAASLRALQATGLPLRPWPKLEHGDVVTIVDGPLRGCRGVLKCRNDRVELLVSVELLQSSVVVKVPTGHISVMPAAPAQSTQSRQAPLLRVG